MSHTTGHVGHWEDLETWLSIATDSLLPKAAETLKHQTQDQLDDNITSLMAQDPSHSYNHKELAKITGSLSHTLIATLKLSDKHAAQRQQELTRAQRRIEQLELEAQERREGSDEAEQGTEEEINQLKETLVATSQELEKVKADYDDRSKKLQYAEQLLEKAKADFKDKNGGFGAGAAALAWMGYWWLLGAVFLATACSAAGDACAGGRRLPAWRPHCSGVGPGGAWGSGGALPPGWGYCWAWGAWVLVGVPPGAWVGACAWARLWCGGLRCIGASAGGGGPIEAG